ncbi:PilW family protein [Candidatus Omnitrophota bacterium]
MRRILSKNNSFGLRFSVYGLRKEPCRTPNTVHRTQNRSFTLIELLVTTAILGIVAVTIGSVFASGLKVYKRVQSYAGARTDVMFALERIERDIRNVLDVNGVDFIGESRQVSFAGIVSSPIRNNRTRKDKERGDYIGRILYYKNSRKKSLVREEQNYSLALKEARAGKGAVALLASIDKVSFKYLYFDPELENYQWISSWRLTDDDKEEWIKQGLPRIPLGIKIEVVFKQDKESVKLARTVIIPRAEIELEDE